MQRTVAEIQRGAAQRTAKKSDAGERCTTRTLGDELEVYGERYGDLKELITRFVEPVNRLGAELHASPIFDMNVDEISVVEKVWMKSSTFFYLFFF